MKERGEGNTRPRILISFFLIRGKKDVPVDKGRSREKGVYSFFFSLYERKGRRKYNSFFIIQERRGQ